MKRKWGFIKRADLQQLKLQELTVDCFKSHSESRKTYLNKHNSNEKFFRGLDDNISIIIDKDPSKSPKVNIKN